MIKLVLLTDLVLDAGTQIRTEINKDHVEDLAEAYQNKDNVPPIDGFHDGGKYIVADGFHRVMGATKAGEKRIKVNVHPGKEDKALLFALRANQGHGLRRTNADKRNAVRIALSRWPKKKNEELAEICGVSTPFVYSIRPVKEKTPEDLSTVELFSQPTEPAAPNKTVPQSQKEEPAYNTASEPPPAGPKTAVIGQQPAEPAEPPIQPELGEGLDDMGYPLPKGVVETWNARKEMQEILEHFVSAKKTIVNVKNCGGSPAYTHVRLQSVLGDLELLIVGFGGAIPYAVCPYCQGINLEQCTNCHHTGLVGKWMFKQQVPTELQAMRKKQIENLASKKK